MACSSLLYALVATSLAASEAAPKAPADSLTSIEDMSLEELLNMETEVASKQATKVVDAPGVITVITRDEIVALGARDLIDILHLVPGFSFAADVENVTSAGFRGVWAHEGKLLLMEDGQELNEPLYSSIQLGYHYPLYNVERIEIVRGPGSAVYGGHAELAVVNMISRNAETMGGVGGQLEYGQLKGDYARRDAQATLAHHFVDLDLQLTAAVMLGQGRRSDERFVDLYGSPSYLGTGDSERIDPLHANVSVDWRDLHVRLLFDQYRLTTGYPFDLLIERPLPISFTTALADVRYEMHISDTLTLTPRLSFKQQLPWHSPEQDALTTRTIYYNKTSNRGFANLTANWSILEGMVLMGGGQVTVDYATARLYDDPSGTPLSSNTPFNAAGALSVSYQNYAAFAQFSWDNSWVNLTLGARFEVHSVFGQSFVPRVALTKTWNGLHFKALATEAFRAPSIENIHLNPQIRPERTLDLELELGYVLTENLYIGVDLFDVTLNSPIVYTVDNYVEGYNNFPKTGSRGIEAQWRYHGPLGFAAVNYSLAVAADKNRVPSYAVPGDVNAVLGLPMHKGTVAVGAKINEHLSIGPSVVVLSGRNGTLRDAAVIERTGVRTLVNLFINYRDLGLPGLDVGLGGYNLLGQGFQYVQAYNAGRAPTPGLSREVMLRVSYGLH